MIWQDRVLIAMFRLIIAIAYYIMIPTRQGMLGNEIIMAKSILNQANDEVKLDRG